MANYPFKINLDKGDGNRATFFTSSFATDAESLVSSSLIIDKINAIPAGNTYIQSEEAVAEHPSRKYGQTNEGITFLSASCTDANTGSISFTDTETSTNGGLNFYTFWGTKVCNVLGLPEGIPIYTENFKLSDDSSNPDNYLSGDVIANGVAIKESFKMSPQARMRSNLVWDEVFGEGYLQWVSGSASELKIGYDTINDKYKIEAATAPTFEISGVDTLTATTINGNLVGNVDVAGGGALSLGGTNAASVSIGNASNTIVNTFNVGAGGHLFQTGIVDIQDTTDATNATGDTGALRVEGGVSIAKKLFTGGAVDVSSTLTVSDDINANGDIVGDGSTDILDINEIGCSKIFHDGDTDTFISLTNDDINIQAGGVNFIDITEGGTNEITFNEEGVNIDFRVEGDTNTVLFQTDAGGDFVTMGAASQDSDSLPRLTVHQNTANFVITAVNSTNNATADGIMVNYTNRADLGTSAQFFRALDSGNDTMYLAKGNDSGGSTVVTSFTAGHDTACLDEDELMPGLIIESTGEVWHKPSASFETALPFTRLSNSNGSKTVFGVVDGVPLQYDATGSITNVRPEEGRFVKGGYLMTPAFTGYAKHAPTGSANRQLNTMSLGEGVMWVTNHNGNIENGDYIESSVIKGYGRKQDDDILRSKTVAKCTETINWSEVTSSIQYSGSTYKKYLTAVTFHCG